MYKRRPDYHASFHVWNIRNDEYVFVYPYVIVGDPRRALDKIEVPDLSYVYETMIAYSGCKLSRGEVLILRGYSENGREEMFTIGDGSPFHTRVSNLILNRATRNYIYAYGRELFDDLTVICDDQAIAYQDEPVILSPERRNMYVDSKYAGCDYLSCRDTHCCMLRNVRVNTRVSPCCDQAMLSTMFYRIFFGNSVVSYDRNLEFLRSLIAYYNVLLYTEFIEYFYCTEEFMRECYLSTIPHCPTLARLILRLNVNEIHETHLRTSLTIVSNTELVSFVLDSLDEPKITFIEDFETAVLRLVAECPL
jgi:hypothetical protein